MNFLTSTCTDVGIKKENNQDSFSMLKANTNMGEVCIAIMCDGMGGLANGEVASYHIVKKFKQWFVQDFPRILSEGAYQDIESQWNFIVQQENVNIAEYSKDAGGAMGTTLTVALFVEDKLFVMHVGDTRLYEITDSNLAILTEDQTLVAHEVRRGIITPEQAEVDPRRNILLQCIGASRVVEPQYLELKAKKNVTYMLCSDGFRHKITDNEIHNAFAPSYLIEKQTMLIRSKNMIELNKSRKETDNITVLLVRTF